MLERGETQTSLHVTNELTELLSTTLAFYQLEKQKEVEKQIQSFINHRLHTIKNFKTPIECTSGAKVVIHLVPTNILDKDEITLDMNLVGKRPQLLPLLSYSGYDYRYNFDGYVTHYHSNNQTSYVQVFRNGCLEILDDGVFSSSEKRILPTRFEANLIQKLPTYVSFLQEHNIGGPYQVFITFINIEGYSLFIPNSFFSESHKINRDEFTLPTVQFNMKEEVSQKLKKTFDVLWNAGGYSASINYQNGSWNPRNNY